MTLEISSLQQNHWHDVSFSFFLSTYWKCLRLKTNFNHLYFFSVSHTLAATHKKIFKQVSWILRRKLNSIEHLNDYLSIISLYKINFVILSFFYMNYSTLMWSHVVIVFVFFSSLIKRSTITRFYHLDNRISLLHSDNNLCIWQNNFTKAVCISFSQGICEIIGNTFKMVAFIYRRVIIVGQRLVVFCSINYFIELSNHPKLLLKNDCHLLLAINASLIDSLHDWLNQGTFVVKW